MSTCRKRARDCTRTVVPELAGSPCYLARLSIGVITGDDPACTRPIASNPWRSVRPAATHVGADLGRTLKQWGTASMKSLTTP
jgi:hypothetical protein